MTDDFLDPDNVDLEYVNEIEEYFNPFDDDWDTMPCGCCSCCGCMCDDDDGDYEEEGE